MQLPAGVVLFNTDCAGESIYREVEAVLVAAPAQGRGNGRRSLVPTGFQIVGMPGLQARPLGDWTSINTEVLLAF
jgi:hypothetical protein